MQASIFILLVVVHHAVQFNTHDIQKFICSADVEIDENRNTVFKLRNSGSSCQYLPLIVDRNGFKFDMVFPSETAQGELGILDLLFEASTARVSLRFQKVDDEMLVYSETLLGTSYSSTIPVEVSADGTTYINLHENQATVLIPSLKRLPTFATDKAVLKVKFIWRNLINGLNVRFPPEIGFLGATTTTTTTTAVTEGGSAPTSSPGNTVQNTANVGPITEVAAHADHTTKAAKEGNQQFKHMDLIIVLSVLAVIGVIGDIVVFVVICVALKRRWRSVPRKPTAPHPTIRRQKPNMVSSGTRQNATAGEFYEFPPPKKANAKMKNRGISFNEYLAVVPAYRHEVALFERANAKDKERMYNTFVRRIRVEESRGSTVSVV